MMRSARAPSVGKAAIFVTQLALGATYLYPLYFMMINALKTRPG